jgi:hypothetical protein
MENFLAVVLGQPRLRDALEQVRSEAEALKDEELLIINVEPLAAVATVRGVLPKLYPLREQIAADLPRFNLAFLDRLELYALALMQAHSLFNVATGESSGRLALVSEARELRSLLLNDVNNLRKHGFLVCANLSQLRGANGNRNIASDVMTLAALLREHWAQVSSHCGASLIDLDRAEVLSDELMKILGERESAPERLAAATLLRRRVYTLFMRAYAEVRKAVRAIVIAPEEARKLTPSVHNRRKRLEKAQVVASVEPAKPSMEEPTEVHSQEGSSLLN